MTIRLIIYLAILLFALISAIRKYKRLDLSLKWIVFLVGFSLLSETIASLAAWKWKNNMPVYHLYTPVNLFITALFFNDALPLFKKYHIGYYLGGIGILSAILNTLFFQGLREVDTNAILFSGVIIVAMSLCSLYSIYISDSSINTLHSWLSLLFLIYWCATFLTWALFQVLILNKLYEEIRPVLISLWVINIFFYGGMGVLFWLPFLKLNRHGR